MWQSLWFFVVTWHRMICLITLPILVPTLLTFAMPNHAFGLRSIQWKPEIARASFNSGATASPEEAVPYFLGSSSQGELSRTQQAVSEGKNRKKISVARVLVSLVDLKRPQVRQANYEEVSFLKAQKKAGALARSADLPLKEVQAAVKASAKPAGPVVSEDSARRSKRIQRKIKTFSFGVKPVEKPLTPKQSAALDEASESLSSSVEGLMGEGMLAFLEVSLPAFIQVVSDRLVRYLDVAGEGELTRNFTERDFKRHVLPGVKAQFPGMLHNMATQIRPNGFIGSGSLRVASLDVPMSTRIGIEVDGGRPQLVIHEIKVGSVNVPSVVRKQLQARINHTLNQQRLPLKIKEIQLGQGSAYISVEVA